MSRSDLRRVRTHVLCASLAPIALLAAACGDEDGTGPTDVTLPALAEIASIREAASVSPAGIQSTVDAFIAELGGLHNGSTVGPLSSGYRQITWEVPHGEAAPSSLPKDFFNAIDPRGMILEGGPLLQFQISATSPNPSTTAAEFGNVNAGYATAFAPFSGGRIFAALTDTVFDVTFRVPGTDEPAVVSGFGAVATDVDLTGSTTLTWYDQYDRELATRPMLASSGNGSVAFLGMTFDSTAVARVRVKQGAAVFGPNDLSQGGAADIVALDDFIYGEPVAIQ